MESLLLIDFLDFGSKNEPNIKIMKSKYTKSTVLYSCTFIALH